MGNIEACIFDLDGVICDTAKYHFYAWRRLADELGFEFTKEDNERLKGVSRMDSLEILLSIGNKTFSSSEKMELAYKKNNWYKEYIEKMKEDEILPGVIPFLEELKKNKIKIALGSVSKNAGIIIDRLNIRKYFDSIIDGNKVKNAKPDPEVFLKASYELEAAPEKCVVFEDAKAGIEAAINADMKSVGIGSPEILNKANLVIPGFTNISIEILKKFN